MPGGPLRLDDYLRAGLGHDPHRVVSRRLGLSPSAARGMAQRHGVELTKEARRLASLASASPGRRHREARRRRFVEAGAGVVADRIVAARLGVSRRVVTDARRDLGIAAATCARRRCRA